MYKSRCNYQDGPYSLLLFYITHATSRGTVVATSLIHRSKKRAWYTPSAHVLTYLYIYRKIICKLTTNMWRTWPLTTGYQYQPKLGFLMRRWCIRYLTYPFLLLAVSDVDVKRETISHVRQFTLFRTISKRTHNWLLIECCHQLPDCRITSLGADIAEPS